LAEHADAAFGEALTLVNRHVEEPERSNMLGQHRHASCEVAFRRAATEAGLTVHALHTEPPGGRYSICSAAGVYFVRSNIQVHCGPPRPTAFREAWAALNRWLDPVQLDLLKTVDRPPADRLCGMIVITSHPRRGEPSLPAFVGLGIPRSDLSSWYSLLPVTELVGRYHDAETERRAPREAPIEIKDRAMPKLKKRSDPPEGAN
jgi:hypothetical protein